jgi:hypothetical protein
MVFTLPDVEVGSIIEYRYAERYNDHIYESPSWYIQGELFVRSAHYQWYPTTHTLVDSQQRTINSISWFKVLPPGATLDHHQLPGNDTMHLPQETYDLLVKDVPPAVHEEYMPPLNSFSYRVLFNFTSYRSGEEFWKSEGKSWSHRSDAFMAENEALRSAAQGIVAGAATPDEKLRKIYAAVMALENTHYTRAHEQREDQADGGRVNNVADVLAHKRGSATQLTELFVAMARAAGLKAYLMLVPNRSETLFTAGWLNFNQFDDSIAVVSVDGKDQFFDPGARYCPYAHLIWQHTFVQGLRQVEGGTAFAQTTGDGYKFNSTARVANLTMDENGLITGKVDLKFTGAQALRWRQAALRGDDASVKRGLRVDLENMLPKSLEVRVSDIQGLEDYEKQLVVSYSVRGTMGTPTGKRLVMPVDLFVSGETASFSHEKRESSVYLQYPRILQDALRVVVPKGFEVEAAPANSKFTMAERAGYTMNVTTTPNSFTTRRDYVLSDFLFPAADYAQLRTFYSQFQSKDQESVVLKVAPAQAAASGGN